MKKVRAITDTVVDDLRKFFEIMSIFDMQHGRMRASSCSVD